MLSRRHIREIAVYALVLIVGIWASMRLDLYEAFHDWSREQEYWELDELVLSLLVVLICLVFFSFNRVRELHNRARLLEASRRDLAKAHERLRTLNRSRETFLTTACHELKSPLIGIVNAFELLRMSADEAEREELIGLAGEAARNLGLVVDSVLEFSRQESLAPVPTVFSPAELLASVRDMSRLQVRSKGLTLTVQPAEDAPALVRGSESVLRLVALNLVGNAMRYTDRGGIHVDLAYQSDPHGELVLTVSDTGRGIRPEDLEVIFEPYSMADGKGPGLGLGLSIVRRSVERCRGSVTVDSVLGEGSRFTVRLPAEAVDAP
ncbi:HAMP domain-containing sensor histidine kinase [Desulfovibrio sp. Huiquan2017]|uniref:sensor histidine kinase n=1 Tax=Desulfovibrio sp. Huiquan2017 TaxID=2816861 RepID=UPI001A92C79A|nr:HAMP domain-containing sensor histidine kinase [Desulfovibrio sp. Huiquan2017]